MSQLAKEVFEAINSSITVDCCIVKPGVFWTVLVKDMGASYDPWSKWPPVNCAQYHSGYVNDPEGPWDYQGFGKNTFKNPKCAHAETVGEMLVVDDRGEVWYHGLGDNKHFEEHGLAQVFDYANRDIKNIHGTIYVAGLHRAVARRIGKDQWEPVAAELSERTQQEYKKASAEGRYLHQGFNCIDGFAADRELYAAGGHGDVWHYDGERWSPIDIPLPQMQIRRICCASDGYVYITGRFGVLLKGRGDDWQIIKHARDSEDLNDVVDYQGTIYVASGACLYQIADDRTTPVRFGTPEIPIDYGYLYVNHGLLMSAGSHSAAIYDGKQWKVLYGASKLNAETDAYITGRLLLQTEELLDTLEDQMDEALEKRKK